MLLRCYCFSQSHFNVLKLLTVARLALFRAIKDQRGSITAISERLRRDRSTPDEFYYCTLDALLIGDHQGRRLDAGLLRSAHSRTAP
jgi:hypothetical protein